MMRPQYQFGLQLIDRFIDRTSDGVTTSGIEHLDTSPTRKRRLYISNHDDIVREPGLLNWTLAQNGEPIAVLTPGVNLNTFFNAVLLKLQPMILVPRGAGSGETLARLVRASLEKGNDVWVAQGAGRTKTGSHETHPKIPYYQAKAHECSIDDFIAKVDVIPVAISSEIDPAAPLVARYAATGRKTKLDEFRAIWRGFWGHKGAAHVAFGPPLRGAYGDMQSAASAIDDFIQLRYKCFPSHLTAYNERSRFPYERWTTEPVDTKLLCHDALEEQVASTALAHRPHLVARYAMAVRERLAAYDRESARIPDRTFERELGRARLTRG